MKNKIEFISLKEGNTVEGIFQSFGKNRFGIYMVLKNGKKEIAINVKASVLKSLIKNNLHLFNEGVKIRIEKLPKPKGKSYFDYSVEVDNKILESSSSKIDLEDVKNLL